VPNPWTDPDKARAWSPDGKPGNVLRAAQVDALLAVAEAQQPDLLIDLGCGPGWIVRDLLRRLPRAHAVCLDESPVMIDRARETLGEIGDRVTYVEAAIETDWRRALPAPADLVLASQAVHHVAAQEKRALFRRVHDALAPGGLLLLGDRVAFDGRFFPHVVSMWNDVRVPAGFEPVSADLDHAGFLARERGGGDVPDTVADQMAWLTASGFAAVECFWRHANQAVIGALAGA
jgi:tRNA (cmo5U34)-methyltransferase